MNRVKTLTRLIQLDMRKRVSSISYFKENPFPSFTQSEANLLVHTQFY